MGRSGQELRRLSRQRQSCGFAVPSASHSPLLSCNFTASGCAGLCSAADRRLRFGQLAKNLDSTQNRLCGSKRKMALVTTVEVEFSHEECEVFGPSGSICL